MVPGTKGGLRVSRLRIEHDGRSFGDVRFSPTMKRGAVKSGESKATMDYYVDLTYPGPRGAL